MYERLLLLDVFSTCESGANLRQENANCAFFLGQDVA